MTLHNRKTVDSSQILSIGYDVESKKLEVEFKTGSIYVYDNVDTGTYAALFEAQSVGKYFGQVIKADPVKYPFTKIAEPYSSRVGNAQ